MVDQGMVIAGDPDRCAATVQRFADVGVDQIVLHMQSWDIPHARIMESIRAFGTRVIPAFSS